MAVKWTRLSGSTHCTQHRIERGECEPYLEIVTRLSSKRTVVMKHISSMGLFGDCWTRGKLLKTPENEDWTKRRG